jgi:hypothetical protein
MTEQNDHAARAIGLKLSKIVPVAIWEEQNEADTSPF